MGGRTGQKVCSGSRSFVYNTSQIADEASNSLMLTLFAVISILHLLRRIPNIRRVECRKKLEHKLQARRKTYKADTLCSQHVPSSVLAVFCVIGALPPVIVFGDIDVINGLLA